MSSREVRVNDWLMPHHRKLARHVQKRPAITIDRLTPEQRQLAIWILLSTPKSTLSRYSLVTQVALLQKLRAVCGVDIAGDSVRNITFSDPLRSE